MLKMRGNPHVYELNTRVFIQRLSEKYDKPLTLLKIPDEEWQTLILRGFDMVWLMGVWQRSPGARRIALLDPSLRQRYDQALPDWSDGDIVGSPYAIYTYKLDESLGKQEDLARLKSKLNYLRLGLMLDFVPNHLAFDHPWTLYHPDWFIQGRESDVHTHPDWFFSPDGKIHLAHGRDPYFPPWTDTVQMNFFSRELRKALIAELINISEVADGVRCDMAMLALNNVFSKVWGEVISGYNQPETEFWVEAIDRVKQRVPDFVFLGEVYWGLESKLHELGFDFTYDKQLYDLLRFKTPEEIRSYLVQNDSNLHHTAHFIENHDEPRAITAFGHEQSIAASVVLDTIPGLRLFHDGQFEGRRIQLPIQLVREPAEISNPELRKFYDLLLGIINTAAFHEGKWDLAAIGPTGESNQTYRNLLAWIWQYGDRLKIVVVNYSGNQAQGIVKLVQLSGDTGMVEFTDELTGITRTQDKNTVRKQGLDISLGPWQAQILDFPA